MFEWNTQRLRKCTQRIVPCSTEGEAERECGTLGTIEPCRQSDIAVKHGIVLPVEAVIVREVRPAIIYAHVTAGTFQKRNRSPDHEPTSAFIGDKNGLVVPAKYLAIVMPA